MSDEETLQHLYNTYINNQESVESGIASEHNRTMLLLLSFIRDRIIAKRRINGEATAIYNRMFPRDKPLIMQPPIMITHYLNKLTNVEIDCSICLATHNKNDSSQINCGHKFGKECLLNWINKKAVKTCPNCREYCIVVTSYKYN